MELTLGSGIRFRKPQGQFHKGSCPTWLLAGWNCVKSSVNPSIVYAKA